MSAITSTPPHLRVTTRLAPSAHLEPPDAFGGVAWLRRGEGLVGTGVAYAVELTGPQRFSDADAAMRAVTERAEVSDDVALPGSGLVAFGSFAFADDSPSPSHLVIPRRIEGVRDGQAFVTSIEVLDSHGAGQDVGPRPHRRGEPTSVRFTDGPVSASEWPSRVRRAINAIGAGAVDKVVLARALDALADAPFDSPAVLAHLAREYPACWTFAIAGLLGATPELLVRTEKGLVTSRVLAGTIRRTGDETQDLVRAARLAQSSKDLEEHEFAVRSVADALAPHCDSMNVPEAPYVLHLPNVMHLATDVTGALTNGMTSLRLAGKLHPSAAVCGTPRDRAAALIAQLEDVDRGRYSGPVGWVGADGDGEWAIALRCAQLSQDGRSARMFAGGGIVAASDPYAELAETESKLVPMREALGGAQP